MAPKVQGTRNDSIHRVPPSFLSAKTLQHCKHIGLNQAYFTRSLIINTFFASLPGVNFIRKKQEYAEVLRHYFTQCVCTGHMGVGHSPYIYYELLIKPIQSIIVTVSAKTVPIGTIIEIHFMA